MSGYGDYGLCFDSLCPLRYTCQLYSTDTSQPDIGMMFTGTCQAYSPRVPVEPSDGGER